MKIFKSRAIVQGDSWDCSTYLRINVELGFTEDFWVASDSQTFTHRDNP